MPYSPIRPAGPCSKSSIRNERKRVRWTKPSGSTALQSLCQGRSRIAGGGDGRPPLLLRSRLVGWHQPTSEPCDLFGRSQDQEGVGRLDLLRSLRIDSHLLLSLDSSDLHTE